jgi:predicted pyridoxine 5'-phosphate oxidase superfamily flavin-nucleotide-binding protein
VTITLTALHRCFEGAIPAVIATASAGGEANVTHLSKVHLVDDDHVALSNQFFSKTVRNLAENPHACVLVIDPDTYDEYRLELRYERTEKRGPVFDRLHRGAAFLGSQTCRGARFIVIFNEAHNFFLIIPFGDQMLAQQFRVAF